MHGVLARASLPLTGLPAQGSGQVLRPAPSRHPLTEYTAHCTCCCRTQRHSRGPRTIDASTVPHSPLFLRLSCQVFECSSSTPCPFTVVVARVPLRPLDALFPMLLLHHPSLPFLLVLLSLMRRCYRTSAPYRQSCCGPGLRSFSRARSPSLPSRHCHPLRCLRLHLRPHPHRHHALVHHRFLRLHPCLIPLTLA